MLYGGLKRPTKQVVLRYYLCKYFKVLSRSNILRLESRTIDYKRFHIKSMAIVVRKNLYLATNITRLETKVLTSR